MIKIMFVAHSGKISGGANRSLLDIVEELRKRGNYAPLVLVPEENSELQQRCNSLGIPVFVGRYHSCCTQYQHTLKDVLRFGKIYTAPFLDLWEGKRLASSFPQDIDLVYTNDRMTVIGAFLAKQRNIPHIWHVRSFAAENATAYAGYYRRIMDRYSDRIVLISRALYEEFARHFSVEKLRLIHNGIHFDRYEIQPVPHEGYNLLLSGRIVPAKGQHVAVEAMVLLARKYHRENVNLLLAGQVPQYDDGGYYLQLQRAIQDGGVRDRVFFLGEQQDMNSVRAQVDLEMMCSRKEAFGRVTIEAMSCGIPVIGTESGGTKDIIQNGKTGFLFPPEDAEKLAETINWCMDNREETACIADRGRRYVRTHFSLTQTVDRIEELIREVLREERN